ncbi:HD domain-containing protein [Actinophytocola oryzae]|uniref:HD domain-containing protein n=1 Tax=Actinophytocola oryzae TaxID=502181 RepID=A0A4V3FQR2_9PSEU|nr:HD domain-containing protein [Actinophytocola oryzae]TDV40681.1 HD domain-containing protein [Actinophytocola oryzae]
MLRTFSASDPWPPDLDDAVAFATHWHGDQRRPAGEPYVEHLREATAFLAYGAGVASRPALTAAVLHDVVEDTPCTLATVRSTFGEEVATLVDWVTKSGDREAYLTRLRSAPTEALLVKLADRASNVQRLDTHPRQEKQRSYYLETVRWIVPLAEGHPWFREWYATWQREFARLGVVS